MGTWGIGPFDNDDAGDMIAGLMQSVKAVAGGDGSYYYRARAAAQFVLAAHGTDILGGPSLAPVVRALARMRGDREWLAGWREPRKVARALDGELRAVIDRIYACKGCRKAIPIEELRSLKALAEEARKTPVPKSVRPKRATRATRAAVRKLLKTKAPRSRRS